MTPSCHPLPSWTTASYADDARPAIPDLSALGQHLRQCSQPGRVWHSLSGGAGALHRGLLARFVTSLALLAMLVGAAAIVV